MVESSMDDFAHMEAAYKAMSAIPVESNRREAAFWWLVRRVEKEMHAETDKILIEATTKMLELQLSKKGKTP